MASASSVAEASSEVSTIALTMPEAKGRSNFNHQRFIKLAENEITLTAWKITPIRRNFLFGLMGILGRTRLVKPKYASNDEIRRDSNNLRSLNWRGLSAIEEKDFPIAQQELVCSGTTVRDFCSAQHMQLLRWRAYSPHMSPIEHVWDLVGRRIARDPSPAAS
ncbi:hypothetical protein TNCV_4377701 [Trichonephila clavipes]|nr:hypothetical protein TNCV_4377701 [Trichonephila clavipes]